MASEKYYFWLGLNELMSSAAPYTCSRNVIVSLKGRWGSVTAATDSPQGGLKGFTPKSECVSINKLQYNSYALCLLLALCLMLLLHGLLKRFIFMYTVETQSLQSNEILTS